MDKQAIAIAVESSHNSKTGRVSATYVTQSACPNSCKFKAGNGCYAESGPTAFTTNRLNRAAGELELTSESIAESEAAEIRKLTGKLPLRVHVVGDCSTDGAAVLVSDAMVEHASKHNQPAWTYTHAWRDVARASWGAANVLASCESEADITDARARGYATALVVDSFDTTGPFGRIPGLIACPEQATGKVDCSSCLLCTKTDVLAKRGLTIAFAVHGAQVKRARAAIGG